MKPRFGDEQIADQKRLARGEQYLFARSRLRVRDCVHQAQWRILILAGGAPAGEIAAIRELMPKAHITAVDKNDGCLLAAAAAGADEIIECDLADFTYKNYQYGGTGAFPAAALRALPCFDIINLDLCAGPTKETKSIIQACRRLVNSGGVFMVTFSYGRDVAEVYRAALERKQKDAAREICQKISDAAQNELVAGRVLFLFPPTSLIGLRSVILYRGAEMPMCSVLFQGVARRADDVSVLKLSPGDFELAVAERWPAAANLYDCPEDRIQALRRSHAAIKASYTRSQRA